MERKTGTPIEKWDDINGNAPEPEPEVVEQPVKLPQEQDPNIIGNVRRGLEDQLEQNDNMIGDGVNSEKLVIPKCDNKKIEYVL